MMNIGKVKITNFKGRTGEFAFAPVTVITGANYAGKSTIPLAVRLALTGYLPPPIGKENRSIFEALAGNPHEPGLLEVGYTLEDGNDTIAGFLRWTRSEKGVVSREGAVPGCAALPAILCEPKTFFGLSGPERVRAIFEACPDARIDTKAFLGTVGEIMAAPAKTRDETVQFIVGKVKELFVADRPDQVAAAMLEETLKGELKRAKDLENLKTGAVQGASAPVGEVPADHSEEIKDIEVKLAAARRNASALDQQWSQAQAAAEIPAKIAELKEELESLKGSEPKTDPTLAIKFTESKRETKEALKAEADAADMVRRWTRALDAVKAGRCPTCGCEGAEMTKRIAGIKASLDTAKATLVEVINRVAKADAKLDEVTQKLDAQSDAIEQFRSSQGRINEIEAEINGLVAVNPPSLPENMEEQRSAAVAEITDYEVKVAALRAKQTDFIAYRQNRSRRDAIESDLLEARCAVEVFGQAVKALSAEVSKATEKAFAKVLSVADLFTNGMLNSRLEFRNGSLGRRVSEADVLQGSKAKVGSWISHEAFSGTEELIAYAAFAVALAAKAPFKLVVMDELSRLTEDRRLALVERMAELTKSGTIDQFIGVDSDSKPWKKCRCAKIIKCA